jgi:peptidyl-Asp metalloendopeptidase
MTRTFRAILSCLPFLIASGASPTWAQGNGSPPQLIFPAAGPSSPAQPGRGVVRSARATPDTGALQQLRAQLLARPSEPRTVVLRFFDDATFVVAFERIQSIGLGAISYYGKVLNGGMGDWAVIAEMDGLINIHLEANGRRFQLRSFGPEGYFARQVDLSSIPEHPPGGAPEANIRPLSKATRASEPAALADDGSLIDLMVLYTPAAKTANGGTDSMNALAALGVSQVNAIYTASGVVQQLRLVYTGEVTHTEINMNVDLDALANTSDGVLDEIHIIRDAYGADFVSLWGVYADYCGLGYVMNPESSGFASLPFNIVASDCTSGGTVLAHELGHNMGLKHDNYENQIANTGTATTTVTPDGSTTPTTISYAHGYVDMANRMRTVMSYNTQCSASGFNCFLISRFSNPSLSVPSPYNSVVAPTGSLSFPYPPAPAAPTQTWQAFEAQVLNDTRETTANFRQAVNTSGGGTVVFLPKTYSIGETSGAVMLSVARLAGSTGAASVNYATANGTATAGSDYLVTSGTLNWLAGETATKTITVPILSDTAIEGNETFTVALSGAAGATVGSNGSTATVKIVDDDADGFPPGCSMPGVFTTTASPSNWRVVTDQVFGGTCSLGSAHVLATTQGTFVNSDLTYAGTFQAGNVTFNYRVSAFGNVPPYMDYGIFEFYVDGVKVTSATGESGWVAYSYPLTAGPHTLTWRFTNALDFECRFLTNPLPPGGANCADAAWIDNLIMPTGAAVTLQSVVARKNHPSSGVWDLPVDAVQLIGGPITTEPRPASGGAHTIAFNFNAGIATPGTVTCLDASNAPVGTCSVAASGPSAIVTLNSVPNNSRVKVSLTNVNGSGTNASASLGFLVGDVNGSRSVTASDILLAKGKTGQIVSVGNSGYDDDLSGTLTVADVNAVKANSGLSLP